MLYFPRFSVYACVINETSLDIWMSCLDRVGKAQAGTMATRKSSTTTTRKTSTPKTAATAGRSKPEAKSAPKAKAKAKPPAAPAVDEVVVQQDIPIISQPEMKKKELIELAVARSGIKKRDAKPAIEAALAVLGEALAQGRELNLKPMGKIKVTRMKKAGNGQIINARVRQPDDSGEEADKGGENTSETPLAPAAE